MSDLPHNPPNGRPVHGDRFQDEDGHNWHFVGAASGDPWPGCWSRDLMADLRDSLGDHHDPGGC